MTICDTHSVIFTDVHALDYSSPPLWDDNDDELFDLESINDNTYDDPFDFKEEKIKDAKLLIDELDPPRSTGNYLMGSKLLKSLKFLKDLNTTLEGTYHRWLSRISKLSPWTNEYGDEIAPDYEASHARVFVLRSLKL
ncbi:hypothetical protein Tco_0902539 [Tanacetum coccineum]